MGMAALQSRPAFAAWPLQSATPAPAARPRQLGVAHASATASRGFVWHAPALPALAILAAGACRCGKRRARGRAGLARRFASSRGQGFSTVQAPGKRGAPPGTLSSTEPFSAEEFGKFVLAATPSADGEELAAALPELRRWLLDRGCTGVDDVRISTDGRPGMQLRAGVADGTTVLRVPREAWISVPLDALELEPEAELAWRLACERWLGAGSGFAPYVDFLWGVDLSLHPVFWEDEEIAWLRVSPGAHEEALSVRQTVAERTQQLAARASRPGSGVPEGVLADTARLEADLRHALVLVEARAIEALPAAEGDPPCAAMVPLLDHLRHDPTLRPALKVGEDEDAVGVPMLAVANLDLAAGAELRSCYEPVGNGHLLAHYGCVPEAEGPSLDDRLRANNYGTVALPVRTSPDHAKTDSPECLRLKLELLAERCDLDMRPGVPGANARLELPRDMYAGGRLMPLARLLAAASQPGPGESAEEVVGALFARHFQGIGSADAPEVPAPTGGDELAAEVVARATAWEWCERRIKRYQKACRAIVEQMGMSPRQCEVRADEEEGPGGGAEPEALVDSVVLAHFKAKSKDGRPRKSKKPREARVLAASDGRATVQFLSNGVRHEIPAEWIVREAAEEPQQEVEVERTRAGRASLALSLFSNEAALVESAYVQAQNVVKQGAEIMEVGDRVSPRKLLELTSQFERDWKQEQEYMREMARRLQEEEDEEDEEEDDEE